MIDITALNQGDSGPNTAEFVVYDDKGNVVSSKEWNLLTGVKAKITFINEKPKFNSIYCDSLSMRLTTQTMLRRKCNFFIFYMHAKFQQIHFVS